MKGSRIEKESDTVLWRKVDIPWEGQAGRTSSLSLTSEGLSRRRNPKDRGEESGEVTGSRSALVENIFF